MTTLTIDIDDEGMRKTMARLGSPELTKLLAMALRSEIHSRVAPYPPSSDANKKSKGKTHYQRGLGSVYTRKRGGRTVRRTSEMAGRKWQMSVHGVTAILRNTASYSGYLWSEAYQPRFHAQRGWQTFEQAWRDIQNDGTIDKIIREVMGDAIRGD